MLFECSPSRSANRYAVVELYLISAAIKRVSRLVVSSVSPDYAAKKLKLPAR